MINRSTRPGDRVVVAREFRSLAEVLSVAHPAYYTTIRQLFSEGRLPNLLKVGSQFTVESVVDNDITISGYAITLREVEGTFPPETFAQS